MTGTGTLSATQGITPTGDPSGVYNTNVALVQLVGDARKADAEAAEHPYPLLAQVFYGDYPAAVDVMRVYTVSEVFAQPSALISGTVAAGWDGALAGWLTTTASSAIGVNDRLAAAYFVRGYGEWLGGITAATTGDVPPDADTGRGDTRGPGDRPGHAGCGGGRHAQSAGAVAGPRRRRRTMRRRSGC